MYYNPLKQHLGTLSITHIFLRPLLLASVGYIFISNLMHFHFKHLHLVVLHFNKQKVILFVLISPRRGQLQNLDKISKEMNSLLKVGTSQGSYSVKPTGPKL